ncbi:MAG: histidine kinase [Tildeniella nuda ZEHNDER 1965/U140]|nr:histidine kinase [Tildeniella nuda ZEHNDER 1965/U140]
MLTLNSAEFISLCRAQVVLLTQTLGASLSVVYLTQELVDGAETQLIPVVAYPETAVDWQAQGVARSLTSAIDAAKPPPWLLAEPHPDLLQVKHLPASTSNEATVRAAETATDWLWLESDRVSRVEAATYSPSEHSQSERRALVPERRIVLPLMHEEVVLGLLVTERSDRSWTEWEQTQIHQIAETLAIACVLDQRYQWLKQDHRQQQMLQEQQHDLLDNLLHQFRNSLTTLQTFGKLILKRLLPEDSNREIAASLVRETARLRDLAQQLELAVAGADAVNLPPLALPPATQDRQLGDRTMDDPATLRQGAQNLPLLPAAGFLSSIPLVLKPCKIATVLEPLLASASAIAQDRDLKLLTNIPEDLPPVKADAQMLQEILSNAIDNALKYTPAGGLVLLQASVGNVKGQTAEDRQQSAEIAITDTGPGIPPQDLLHLFERRYRGIQAQTDIPGSGLGLSIARTLVTQMHGEIDVFSPARMSWVAQEVTGTVTSKGPGTTVVIRLAIA